jgi:hypothetical protein
MAFLPVMALSAVSGWAGAALLRRRPHRKDADQQSPERQPSPFAAYADAFGAGAPPHTPRMPSKRARGSGGGGGDTAGGSQELALLPGSPGGSAGSMLRYAPPPPSYGGEQLLLWDPSQASPPVLACVAAQTLQRWSLTQAAAQLHAEHAAFCCSAAGAAGRYSGAGGPLEPAAAPAPTVMNLNVCVNSRSESIAPPAPPPAAEGSDGKAAKGTKRAPALLGWRLRLLRALLTVLAWELGKGAHRRRRARNAPPQRTVAVLGHAAWKRAAATPLGSLLMQQQGGRAQQQRRRRGGGQDDDGVVQKFGLFVL